MRILVQTDNGSDYITARAFCDHHKGTFIITATRVENNNGAARKAENKLRHASYASYTRHASITRHI
jgi:hypothetical protein